MTTVRQVIKTLNAQPTSDGDGVKIKRISGFNIKQFSPFLMIDELRSDDSQDYIGGFPSHPHRGIETFSYMIKGHFQHKDSLGNSGQLRSGGAQWMASGRGIIHSEMPMMDEGQLHGFQIWINQHSTDKYEPAQYADFQPEMIPQLSSPELGTVRVLAGDSVINDILVESALEKSGTPINFIDWRAQVNQTLQTALNQDFNAMIYVYKGSLSVGDLALSEGQLGFLSKGEVVNLMANGDSGALILAGKPIDEPVVHYGPFVMNSMDEINQAINDYNQGLFETYK
ncbi:pirin family protein [Vibrio maerlii]|uniref:pirin family protein n=1 Tax=Vibrio maerlii TaxID=2231648 RepID=UPI000E3BCA39|nr:pirin family protein [Vibrio maerlii]